MCTKAVSTVEEEEECNLNLAQSKENEHEEQNPTNLSGCMLSIPPYLSTYLGIPNSKMKYNIKENNLTCQFVE